MLSLLDETWVVSTVENLKEELARARRSAETDRRSFDQAEEAMIAGRVISEELKLRAERMLEAGKGLPDEDDEHELRRVVMARVFPGPDRLLALLADEDVINVNFNGYDVGYVYRKDGSREQIEPIVQSDKELEDLVRQCGLRQAGTQSQFDPTHPSLDVQLSDGSRLHAVGWITPRIHVAVRRHGHLGTTLKEMIEAGIVTPVVAQFLHCLVLAGFNVVVSGEQGAGKTTLVRAMGSSIPKPTRLVTIEQVYELGFDQDPEHHDDVVAYVTRDANSEGAGRIDTAALMREQFRMSAQRTIVGEVLDEELVPMLTAMLASRGSLCTLHAKDGASTCSSMITRALVGPQRLTYDAAASLIADAVDFVVFMERRVEGYGGRVASIHEVAGLTESGRNVQVSEIFAPGPDGHATPRNPVSPTRRSAIEREGFDFANWTSELPDGDW